MTKIDRGALLTIDEALERTYFGKFNIIIIIFSGFVINNVVLESVGISFALPVLECDLNLTYQQQGVLGAVAFVGIISSSHLWGFLADTMGRKRIMRPTLILGYAVTVLSSLSPSFEIFAILRFVNGILLSGGSATIFAYIGEFHCQKHRNRAILSGALISAVLSIFFPMIAWGLINQNWQFEVPIIDIVFKPWRSYILACGLSGFLCGLLLFYLPESPKYLLSVGRADEAIAVLKSIHQQNTQGRAKYQHSTLDVIALTPDLDTPTNEVVTSNEKKSIQNLFHSMWRQTSPLFMREHIRKTFLSSLIQFIIFYTAHGVYMWFPYILNSSMQYTQSHLDTKCLCDMLRFTQSHMQDQEIEDCAIHLEISTYQHTIMLEIIYVGLLLTIIYIIGKVGRKLILFIILFVCGACGILGLFVNIPLIAIYLMIIFLCCGLGTAVVNAIVIDIYPTNLRAMAVCISLMIGRIGSVTGSNVLGALIDKHCEAALLSAAGALIVAGFLGLLLPKRQSKI